MAVPVYYHPRVLAYDFGPRHPFCPERLVRTVSLLKSVAPDVEFSDPGEGCVEDVFRVHSQSLIDLVGRMSEGEAVSFEEQFAFGFSSGDTPPFRGMLGATLAYGAGTVAGARSVLAGGRLAVSMSGGLHHAKRSRANGFCVFDDVAIACDVLREEYERVLYVDIDLHHGDGPESIFDDVREVATLSIHESGRSLYPGTGFETDHGSAGTSFNLPMVAGTTGDVWFWAFREGFLSLIDWFRPEVIVLQMGCDAHFADPLGHLKVSVQDWVRAVALVMSVEIPLVVAMGGGYAMTSVPRMWAAGVLTLLGREVPSKIPDSIPAEWGMRTFFDPEFEVGFGMEEAERVVGVLQSRLDVPL